MGPSSGWKSGLPLGRPGVLFCPAFHLVLSFPPVQNAGEKTLRQNGHVAGPVCTGGKASTGDKAGAGHNGSDPSLAGLLGIR